MIIGSAPVSMTAAGRSKVAKTMTNSRLPRMSRWPTSARWWTPWTSAWSRSHHAGQVPAVVSDMVFPPVVRDSVRLVIGDQGHGVTGGTPSPSPHHGRAATGRRLSHRTRDARLDELVPPAALGVEHVAHVQRLDRGRA